MTMIATAIEVPTTLADTASRLGTSSISPFTIGDETELLLLADGGVAGVVRRGRWAIMATSPVTPHRIEDLALAEVLGRARRERLRPVFAAVPDPQRFAAQGMHVHAIA